MNCSIFNKSIDLYFNNGLTASNFMSFEQHITRCPACAKKFEIAKMVHTVIDQEKQVAYNPFIATRVMAIIEQKGYAKRQVPVFKKLLQPVLLAASVAIAITVGYKAGALVSAGQIQNAPQNEMLLLNDEALESLQILINE